MTLFGNLFGGAGGFTSQDPISTEAQPITVEFLEMAIELIDDFVESPNAEWVEIANDQAATDEPWKTGFGQNNRHNVKIVFLQDTLEDRQLLKYLKGTEVKNGNVNGIMYPQGFTPTLKDVVLWQGRQLTVNAIDPLAPVDSPIIYIMEFGA